MNCHCEPHASGGNRCAYCRYEAESEPNQADWASALRLIQDIARDGKVDPSAACDAWLERNGFECESSRRRQRERRAEQLDAEIERLRAERAKL